MPFWNKDTWEEQADDPAAPIRKETTMARDDRQTGDINALLGRGATFEGKLTFEGTVRIDGHFKGEIFTDDVLVVGEGARVEAEVKAGALVVHGEVRGNVTASKSVELHQPARVIGNITTPSLQIDKGVIFEGTSKMQNLDQKGGGRPAAPPPAPPQGGEEKAGK